jgi:hypothetical protein
MTHLEKKIPISNFTKICPVGAEVFLPEGQPDMTLVIVAFRNFALAPKKLLKYDKDCYLSIGDNRGR